MAGPEGPGRDDPDGPLVERARRGDADAFDEIVRLYGDRLVNYIRAMLGPHADAEDVAQEVFVKVASRIADYDRSRDGLTWVYAIAAFEVRTHLRRLQRRREVPPLAEDAEPADPMPSPVDLMIEEEISRTLVGALGELSDADRTLLEIGERSADSGLTGTAIRKRRQRALGRLRAVWSKLYG